MILFTADWHLKLGQKNVPKAWALERYKRFFAQVRELESKVGLHIIGGDLFDRVPSMEEQQLYWEFISGVTVPTLIYDGNHEATKKNQTFFNLLKDVTKLINPSVNIITEPYWDEFFSILPYCYLHRKGSIEKFSTDRPLFTHVRGEIPPHVKPEVDLDRFKDFPVVFAGDLHAHSNTQRNIVYPGSPMTTSFHRTEVSTGYILIDETDWSWEWKEFNLPQLIRKTVTLEDQMVPTDYHHTIYELEGNLQDLSNIKNSELLDKKVIRRASEAALILEKDMNISDELFEYLIYILGLEEQQAKDVIGVFHDYSAKIALE